MVNPLFLLLAAAASPPSQAPAPVEPPAVTVTPSGLRFETLVPGTGPHPGPGDAVLVTYEGRLDDGSVFDRAETPVGLAVSGTVPGFAEALGLMRKGGTYRFRIPPHLAYGARGSGAIPPNSTLEFTLTLHRIGRPAAAPARD